MFRPAHAAIYKQFGPCHMTALVRCKEQYRLGDFFCLSQSAQRNNLSEALFTLLPCGVSPRSSRRPSVSMGPGLTAFTRIFRPFRPVVQVRAKERIAALVAA